MKTTTTHTAAMRPLYSLLTTTRYSLLFLLLSSFFLPPSSFAESTLRPRVLFNDGWLFQKGDPTGFTLDFKDVGPLVATTGDTLLNYNPSAPAKPRGSAQSKIENPKSKIPTPAPAYALSNYDDASWRKLTLPHDWGIEGPFSQKLPGNTGKLPFDGIGWYRKHFDLPAGSLANGHRVYLEIDGAHSHSLVFVNGHLAGGWPYGYTSYRVDLTPHLKDGASNTLAIRLDNPPDSSRWYPGGGIYRNVWLTQTAPVAVAQWGVFVTTPTVTRDRALAHVAITLDNTEDKPADVDVSVRIFAADDNGRPTGPAVATGTCPSASKGGKVNVPANNQSNCSIALPIANPRLWSLAQRNRYVAETTVTRDGKTLDRVETPFGIRTLEFKPNQGFFLNGEHIRINGVCQHADLGALGAAINTRALERQIEILQSFGCNAIRTSHNPPAPELLDACDRMGMLVMDEAFDMWLHAKRPNGYAIDFPAWHEKDLRALIRRDRNHPSVILWSIGNEIPEMGSPTGWKLTAHLAAIARSEDSTRPITAACSATQAGYNGCQNALDILGYNYKPGEYAKFHARYPHIPVFGSETQSAVSSRGEYFFPVVNGYKQGQANFQVTSYDTAVVPWGQSPAREWAGQEAAPHALGEFVWTGFDYLGEPTPYNNDSTNLLNFTDPADKQRMAEELKRVGKLSPPSRSSYFGIVDLAGFPKDRYYLFQAHWLPDHPMSHILPHWTWPERVGQVTPVFVYSSGDEVELFLNNKSLGRQKPTDADHRFRWDNVKYAPGELKAVAYKNGKPWATDTMRTASAPAKIQLTADRTTLHAAAPAGDPDLSYITATILDAAGTPAPRANNQLKFTLTGPAEILATDNGDATSFESFQSPIRRAYNGLALVIIRTKPGEKGAITLTAQSDTLAPAEITLRSE